LALTLAVAAAGRVVACSQCLCGSPTPPGFLLDGESRRLTYGLEDRFLSKSNELDDANGTERQTEHRLSGFLTLRPAAPLTIQARLPYAFKTNTRRESGMPDATLRTHGLGDADLLARLDVRRFGSLLVPGGRIAAMAGVVVPTGSSGARDAAGDRLDAHLQPGTGAWSGEFGVGGDAARSSTALSASVTARVNGANARGFRYGDVLLFNLGCARALDPAFQAAVELNGRSARRDRTEDGGRDPNSGGTVVYLAPGLRWSGLRPLALDVLVQIPIAQSLNGSQNEKATGRLAIVWLAP
jgi:hypothetical protein